MSDILKGILLSDPEEKGGENWSGSVVTLEEEDGTIWSVAAWNEVGDDLMEYSTGDEIRAVGVITDMELNRFTAYRID